MLRAVAFLALVVTATTSQPPPPVPAKTAQENQNQSAPAASKTEANQKTTSTAPAGGSQGGSPSPLWIQQQLGNQAEYKPPTDWWPIAATALNLLFTALLVILMFRQWLAMEKQAVYMRGALKETRKAADAASGQVKLMAGQLAEMTASREHAYALARARIVIDSIETTSWYENNVPNDISVTFRNTGQTPAINVTLSGDRFVRQSRIMPGSPGSEDPQNLLESNVTIGANDTMSLDVQAPSIYGIDDIADVAEGRCGMYVAGGVRYDDIFGTKDRQVFQYAAKYDRGSAKWIQYMSRNVWGQRREDRKRQPYKNETGLFPGGETPERL